jgi:hypothetical protein
LASVSPRTYSPLPFVLFPFGFLLLLFAVYRRSRSIFF